MALGPASSPRRQAQFAMGRACARAALVQLGFADATPIGRGEGRRPAWPGGAIGSITHSHEVAVAAAAHAEYYRGVGVDLERLRAPSPELMRRICRPAELASLERLPVAHLPTAFTTLFAVKESIYKALNPLTGIYLGFQDAELAVANVDWTSDGGTITWVLTKDNGPDFPGGASHPAGWRRSDPWVVAGVWVAA